MAEALMTFRVRFPDKEWAEFDRRFYATGQATSDLRPLWQKVVAIIGKAIRANFDREGSIHGAWTALKDYVQRAKDRDYPGKPILERTGALRRAATEDAPGREISLEPLRLEYGVDMRLIGATANYAYFHDAGAGQIRREFMILDQNATDEIRWAIARYLEETCSRIWRPMTELGAAREMMRAVD